KDLRTRHTVLLSTHILPEVEQVCERVIIVNYGRIGLDKKLSELESEAPTTLVEVRGPVGDVTKALESTDGVDSVKAQRIEDGLTSFEVHTTDGRDLREEIASRVAKNGWALRRLDLRRRKLEDHFLDVVVRAQSVFEPVRMSGGSSTQVQASPQQKSA